MRLEAYPATKIKADDDAVMGDGAECCVVCIEPFAVGDKVRSLSCCHSFHKECIDHWLSSHTTCPLCNLELETYDGLDRNEPWVTPEASMPGVVVTADTEVTVHTAAGERSARSSISIRRGVMQSVNPRRSMLLDLSSEEDLGTLVEMGFDEALARRVLAGNQGGRVGDVVALMLARMAAEAEQRQQEEAAEASGADQIRPAGDSSSADGEQGEDIEAGGDQGHHRSHDGGYDEGSQVSWADAIEMEVASHEAFQEDEEPADPGSAVRRAEAASVPQAAL